jgi:hypothetical protein
MSARLMSHYSRGGHWEGGIRWLFVIKDEHAERTDTQQFLDFE